MSGNLPWETDEALYRANADIVVDSDAPILDAVTVAQLCEVCGRCCITEHRGEMIGGTPEAHWWLAKKTHLGYAECRFLMPLNHERKRLCAIRNVTVIEGRDANGIGVNPKPLRPQLCIDAPTRGNLDCLPDCPVTRAAKEKLQEDVT